MDLIIMAKEPRAGFVKTRLCPPCTPIEAALIAEACLADTLDAAVSSGADRITVALDGLVGDWCPAEVRVIPQVEGRFAARLAAAWASVPGPAVQIGMDTPQVTGADLDAAMSALVDDLGEPTDAVLGKAIDGGWWLLGQRRPHLAAFDRVVMSAPDTAASQRRQLERLGMRVVDIGVQRDVDTFEDALAVVAEAPHTRFAPLVASVAARLGAVR